MKDEFKNKMNEEEGQDDFETTVTLIDDDGNEVEFCFLDIVEYNEATYAALIPVLENEDEENDESDDDDLVIMRIDMDEEGNEFLSAIDDEDEFNAVAAEFVELLSDEYDIDMNGDE